MDRKLAKLTGRGNHSTQEPGRLVQSPRLDRRADPDLRRQSPFGTLDTADLDDFAWLDFINSGPAQCRRMQEDVTFDLFTGHETIATQGVEPFHNGAAEGGIDTRIGVEAPGSCRGLFVTPLISTISIA